MDGMQELAAAGAANAAAEAARGAVEAEAVEATYLIRIKPRGDLFVRGVTLTGLLGELAELGALTTRVDDSRVPALALLDPSQCYLSVEAELVSTAGMRAIEDTLMFLDEGEFVVERLGAEEIEAGARPDRGTSRLGPQGRACESPSGWTSS